MANKDITVSIAISASLSAAVKVRPASSKANCIVGVEMPSSWDAANLTLQVSTDGGSTFNNVYDKDGDEVVIEADASRYVILNPALFAGIDEFKLRSGTSGTPVVQTAARTIKLVMVEAD